MRPATLPGSLDSIVATTAPTILWGIHQLATKKSSRISECKFLIRFIRAITLQYLPMVRQDQESPSRLKVRNQKRDYCRCVFRIFFAGKRNKMAKTVLPHPSELHIFKSITKNLEIWSTRIRKGKKSPKLYK